MERKLAEVTQTNERLTKELEDQKKKALTQTPIKRNIQNDLQRRQAKLIQEKEAHIKSLNEQVQATNKLK